MEYFQYIISFISFVCFKLLTNRKASTSSEHHGTFAVFTVVVVFVSGAEAGAVGGQAALLPCCATVTSQIQPEGEETHRRTRSDETVQFIYEAVNPMDHHLVTLFLAGPSVLVLYGLH